MKRNRFTLLRTLVAALIVLLAMFWVTITFQNVRADAEVPDTSCETPEEMLFRFSMIWLPPEQWEQLEPYNIRPLMDGIGNLHPMVLSADEVQFHYYPNLEGSLGAFVAFLKDGCTLNIAFMDAVSITRLRGMTI